MRNDAIANSDSPGMTNATTSAARSQLMSRVKGKDTKPEMALRSLIWGMGYRYRLHDRSLPGSPDLVFKSRMKVVFMHGCFWHRHEGCARTRTPKTKQGFWKRKFEENVARDHRNQVELEKLGWRFLIVWECELKNSNLKTVIREFLGPEKVDS